MKTLVAAVIFAIALIAAPTFARSAPAAGDLAMGGGAIGTDASVRLG